MKQMLLKIDCNIKMKVNKIASLANQQGMKQELIFAFDHGIAEMRIIYKTDSLDIIII